MPGGTRSDSFLDTSAARIIAGLVIAGVVAALVYFHRADLFASREVSATGNPALDACIAERTGHVQTMLDEGVIRPDQADSFRARAVQVCEGMNPPAAD